VFVDRPRGVPAALLFVTSAAICCLGLALVLPELGARAPVVGSAALATTAVGVAMLLGAGCLCLSRWWIDGSSRAALVGAAALVYGVGAMALSYLNSLTPGDEGQSIHDELARAVLAVVVAALIVRAVSPRDIGENPVLLLVMGLFVVIGGAVLLETWHGLAPNQFHVSRGTQFLAQLILGFVWFGAAIHTWRQADRHPGAGLVGSLLLGFSLARILDAAAPERVGSPLHLGASLLWAIVACAATYSALVGLRDAVEADQHHLEAVQQALSRATHGVAQRDAWREELSHDAINALAGLRAALATLSATATDDMSEDGRRLYKAALQEVAHLEHLVDRSTQDRPVEFDVADVIETAVETRRACGLQVRVGDIAARAVGRPGDLTTVLQNLLINAARHAPGSRVRIDASRFAGRLGIHVVDDGPGIPPALRERIFDRGYSGPESKSTGLGLYVARQLMREQGGDLELLPTEAGCAFLISLAAGSEITVRGERVPSLPEEVSSRLHGLAVVGARTRAG